MHDIVAIHTVKVTNMCHTKSSFSPRCVCVCVCVVYLSLYLCVSTGQNLRGKGLTGRKFWGGELEEYSVSALPAFDSIHNLVYKVEACNLYASLAMYFVDILLDVISPL